MINGNIKDFLDSLYIGQELLFSYKEVKYFIQGWTKDNGEKHLECWEYETQSPFLWEADGPSMSALANSFLDAPLWDGKTLEEIEACVTWLEE